MVSKASPNQPEVVVGEEPNFAVDMRPKLQNGELITGTPLVVEVGTTDLTITGKARNSSASIEVQNESVPVDMAVVFHVTGFVADVVYEIKVTVVTDASNPATRIQKITLPSEAF